MPRSFALFLFQMVFMDTTATIPTGAMAERWTFKSFVDLRLLHCAVHLPALRQLGLGRRLAVAARQELRPGPRPRRLRRLLGRPHDRRRARPWSAPRCSVRASASSTRTARPTPSPATTSRWRSWAASSSPSAGSGSTPAPPWPGRTCGSAWSPSTPCSPPPAAPCSADALHVAHVRQARPLAWCANGLLAGLVAITAPCAFVTPRRGRSSSG